MIVLDNNDVASVIWDETKASRDLEMSFIVDTSGSIHIQNGWTCALLSMVVISLTVVTIKV